MYSTCGKNLKNKNSGITGAARGMVFEFE